MDKLQRVLDEFSVGKIITQTEISHVEIKNEIFHRYLVETTRGLFLLAETKDSFEYDPSFTKNQSARLIDWLTNKQVKANGSDGNSSLDKRNPYAEFLTLLPKKLMLKNASLYVHTHISEGKEYTVSGVHKFDNQYWLFAI